MNEQTTKNLQDTFKEYVNATGYEGSYIDWLANELVTVRADAERLAQAYIELVDVWSQDHIPDHLWDEMRTLAQKLAAPAVPGVVVNGETYHVAAPPTDPGVYVDIGDDPVHLHFRRIRECDHGYEVGACPQGCL